MKTFVKCFAFSLAVSMAVNGYSLRKTQIENIRAYFFPERVYQDDVDKWQIENADICASVHDKNGEKDVLYYGEDYKLPPHCTEDEHMELAGYDDKSGTIIIEDYKVK